LKFALATGLYDKACINVQAVTTHNSTPSVSYLHVNSVSTQHDTLINQCVVSLSLNSLYVKLSVICKPVFVFQCHRST